MNTFTDPKLNLWLQFQGEDAEEFLHGLRDTSSARKYCRNVIQELLRPSTFTSLLEIGVGGLNERIALDPHFSAHPSLTYTGTDWAPQFVQQGREQFPSNLWSELDIVKGTEKPHLLEADIVYSQHVLEHCGGLTPALPNMLSLTKSTLLNIFFIPVTHGPEHIDWYRYPIYHNVYSVDHIRTVCDYHGFDCTFQEFFNNVEPRHETVLTATRRAS